MKKLLIVCCLAAVTFAAKADWKPAGDKIKTPWAEQVDPNNVLPEYPRPQMVRADWVNLNGLWDYAITRKGAAEPANFDGEILVPFAIESSLSGVQKEVGDRNELWYKKSFTVPASWKKQDILLQFGAVDWRAEVFVNDILIGKHEGGFTPFSFNITPYLNGSGAQKLVVRVWDPTDRGYQATGKQRNRPEGIWYTPVTGIWQTVWLEPVAKENYITSIKAISDIDNQTLKVTANAAKANEIVEVTLLNKGQVVATGKGVSGKEIRMAVKNPTLWDTENPFLYDMTVSVISNGKVVDKVGSYTAFRKIATWRDRELGITRMQLNNKNVYHHGPLDQGWWPDGLYTAPTDEALLFDIKKTKDWGFNMIRKHVKVEPARWYYHCDREGILVWQDMPSGDTGNEWGMHAYGAGTDKNRTPESVANYYQEWKEIMDLCISNPSVVVWVPFNEAWGQFDTEKVVKWTKEYDPSRLVNPASGGNHRSTGDILDLHNYPGPDMYLYDGFRVTVLGEYGGIGLPLEGHLWNGGMRNWGYIEFKNAEDVTKEYVKYAKKLMTYVNKGFSASVYTQTTDVEGEINGLMTYDRKVMKVIEADIKKANQDLINTLK